MFSDVVHGMGRLLAYFYELIPNYGIGIIFLTILVRVAMIPLAVKQAHIMEKNRGNAEKMRKLLPEVKKIKEKYKDDKARQYEEQKKLYDHHGVNMLGGLSGCLPMLVQMPIFLAMYQVLSGCNKIFGGGRKCTLGFHLPNGSGLKEAILDGRASFLGMNLNFRPSEVLQNNGLGRALPYYLLIAVMGYTMWYQTRQMMKAQPVVDPQMMQTQKIMQFMPLLLVFASLNFPAGLTVYWSATNIWSIAQQFVLMRKFGPLAREQEARAPAPSGILSGLVGRLKGTQSTRGDAARGDTGKGERKPPAARQAGRAPNKGGARPVKPAAQGPKTSSAKPAQKPGGKTPAKPAPQKPSAQKPSAQAAKISTPEPESEKPEGQSVGDSPPERPAGEASGQAAGKPAASKTPERPGSKQRSGGGGRRPAANRARTAPAGKPGQPKTGAKSPAGKAESAAGGRPTGTGAAPGRPKGSGARKKRQGR